MIETYVTYKLWDGCKAPNNLESGTRLVGQRVGSVSVDRDALLALADDIHRLVDDQEIRLSDVVQVHESTLSTIERRIREALGVRDG